MGGPCGRPLRAAALHRRCNAGGTSISGEAGRSWTPYGETSNYFQHKSSEVGRAREAKLPPVSRYISQLPDKVASRGGSASGKKTRTLLQEHWPRQKVIASACHRQDAAPGRERRMHATLAQNCWTQRKRRCRTSSRLGRPCGSTWGLYYLRCSGVPAVQWASADRKGMRNRRGGRRVSASLERGPDIRIVMIALPQLSRPQIFAEQMATDWRSVDPG